MPREAPGSVRNRKKAAERNNAPITQAQIRGMATQQRRENRRAQQIQQEVETIRPVTDEELRAALADPIPTESNANLESQEWQNVQFDEDWTKSPEYKAVMEPGAALVLGNVAGMTKRNEIPTVAVDPSGLLPGQSNVTNGLDIRQVGTETKVDSMLNPEKYDIGRSLKNIPASSQSTKTIELNSIKDFHNAARSKETTEYKGYCFPECTNAKILSQLEILIPHLTIFKYNTGTFPEVFQNFINGLHSLSMGSIGHDKDQDDTLNELYGKLVKSISNTALPPSINLLFCSLPCEPDCKIRLPITSSPLSINSQLDHGWKANQSIFDFIKKQLGGSGFSSTFGKLFGGNGESVLKLGTDVANLTENLMHIFGRDIQLGPYWSIGEGALDNRQSLSFSTILVNDSKEHYDGNAEVLRKLFVESQPNALEDNDSMFRIKPPSIFDIELDTCTAGKKKYFLCAGQFSCEPKGRYFKNKIPEAYSLSLTFNSLIPDLLKIQQEKGVYHA